MDSEPFRDLHHILQDLDDDRIWVFAEWVRRHSVIARGDSLHKCACCCSHAWESFGGFRGCPHVQIGKAYMPKQQGLWTAGYHEKLYNLTDDAIRGAGSPLKPVCCSHQ